MNFGIAIGLISYVGALGTLGFIALLLAGAAIVWLVALLVYLFVDMLAFRESRSDETPEEKLERICRECDERMREGELSRRSR